MAAAAAEESGEGSDSDPEEMDPEEIIDDDKYRDGNDDDLEDVEEEGMEEPEEEEEEKVAAEGDDQEARYEGSVGSMVYEDDDRFDSNHNVDSNEQDEDLTLEKIDMSLASHVKRENNVVHYDYNSRTPLAKEGQEPPFSSDRATAKISWENLGSFEAKGPPMSVAHHKGIGAQIEMEVPFVERLALDKGYDEDQNGNDNHKETKLMGMESGDDIKLRASSSITPLLRPRSSSPGAGVERNKKPAIICDFFARGWCIKGSSCRFLHQKDGQSNNSKCTKNNVIVGSSEAHSVEDAGSRQPTRSVILDSSIKNDTLGKVLPEENKGSKNWYRSSEEHKLPTVGRNEESPGIMQSEGSRSFDHLSLHNEFPWKSPTGEYGSFKDPLLNHKWSHYSNHVDSRRLASVELIRGYPLGGIDSISSYRSFSSGSTLSSIYGNNNDSLGYGKGVMEPPSAKPNCQPSIYNSRSSPEFSSSFNSSLNTSLPSIGISPSQRGFTWSGSSPFIFSPQFQNSSPFYPRSAPDNLALHVISRDPYVSIGKMTSSTMNSWEPSVPFRPSFDFSSILSYRGRQYDPFIDSCEHPNGEVRPFQSSSNLILSSQNTLHKQILGDSLASQHPQSAISNQSIHSGDIRAYANVAQTAIVGQESRSPKSKEEKPLKLGHVVNSPSSKKEDLDSNHGLQTDGSKLSKEAKILKYFRASLIDFVKELVKPFWHEGRLSKDAHNIVVKKAVDKVISAYQPDQIPSTAEAVSQYLSFCQTKLEKLVEAYVGKYGKS
ncbi:hypothetical protein Sjap_000308 [Stephania japonica]|uniref:C3H1-type domain-containing protein n=1 Tax=Stephania japonica TaxID=461633 RepID=A0AAP0PQA6_9MAGN